jgi:hypothetical protein
MISRQIEVRIPAPVQPPRGAVLAGTLAAWLLQWTAKALAPRPAHDLRTLAHDVEAQQPALAAELRGIALHCEALQRSAG